jgi:hypothetical protein
MSIMLNESNSSFDTTPSFDFVMRQDDDGQERDDEVMVSDADDDDEGFDVVANGAREHRDDIGVLIVPPTTGSSENSRNTVLSIPDSVPTVLNSAMLDLPECVHVVDTTAQATPVRSNSLVSKANEGDDRKSQERTMKGTPPSQNTWRRNVWALFVVAAVSIGSVGHAFYLHRESLLLKEQVRLLTDQAARSAATLDELQRKQASEVVLDNCWLLAHAKVSLGECSQEATESMKEKVSTFGSSVHNFWERTKELYQENVKEKVKDFDGFYSSYAANVTTNVFTNVKDVWNQLKESNAGNITENLNTMGSCLQDIWNQSKATFSVFYNVSEPVTAFGSGTVYRFWKDVTGVNEVKMKDSFNVAGQSLREASSTVANAFHRGYNDLKDSVTIFYQKSDAFAASSNGTVTDTIPPGDFPGNLVESTNELPSVSKKVLIAAAWSAGAAILVSTFDMYWNQHGNLLALEN